MCVCFVSDSLLIILWAPIGHRSFDTSTKNIYTVTPDANLEVGCHVEVWWLRHDYISRIQSVVCEVGRLVRKVYLYIRTLGYLLTFLLKSSEVVMTKSSDFDMMTRQLLSKILESCCMEINSTLHRPIHKPSDGTPHGSMDSSRCYWKSIKTLRGHTEWSDPFPHWRPHLYLHLPDSSLPDARYATQIRSPSISPLFLGVLWCSARQFHEFR